VREALIEAGAVDRVAEVMRRMGLTGPVFLVADENTYRAAGERVCSVISKAGIRVHEHILEGRPRADVKLADSVAAAVPPGASTVVSCGSGTVTDMGKWAAKRNGLPLVAVATAPSMNGYASGIAALVKDGLKATQPIQPAVAVICDIEVLAAAPMEMIRAGLGDLMSKPVCNADWKLSTHIRGGTFCRRPFELVRDLEECYSGRAHLLEERDPKTIAALSEALVYSGVSMLLAGSSSPASGGEHLISHVLDMRAYAEDRLPRLHGEQVGVGTLSTARLYERMLSVEAGSLDQGAIARVWERGDEALSCCREFFGGAFDAVEAEHAMKRGARGDARAEAARIAGEWDEIREQVRPYLVPSARIRETLESAGAVVSYADLGVAPEVFRDVLALAMCARSRYTVLDAAFSAGLLEGWVDDVIERP
jgi:glycerol-1-phosphate dehydrogenase [NAD(P)+]